jgi:tryptophan synthase alpha chain
LTKARIDARFAALKAEGRAAFIPYVMAGIPTRRPR